MSLRVFARVAIPCLLVIMLFLAGCAGPGVVIGATPTPGTVTPSGGGAHTPTGGGNKPTGTLTIDQAFCERILTLSEASQIMGAEAKSIRVMPGTTAPDEDGGSCNYEATAYHAVVFVAFFAFAAGASLDQVSAAITSAPGFAGKVTAVSGVGDAAKFIVNPIPSTSLIQYHLMVKYGSALLDVVNPGVNGVKDASKAQEQLEQVARTVLGRL